MNIKANRYYATALITVSCLDVLFDMGRQEEEENGDPSTAQWVGQGDVDPGEEEESM